MTKFAPKFWGKKPGKLDLRNALSKHTSAKEIESKTCYKTGKVHLKNSTTD